MDLASAKAIGAGIAIIALAGVGVGIGHIFAALISAWRVIRRRAIASSASPFSGSP